MATLRMLTKENLSRGIGFPKYLNRRAAGSAGNARRERAGTCMLRGTFTASLAHALGTYRRHRSVAMQIVYEADKATTVSETMA